MVYSLHIKFLNKFKERLKNMKKIFSIIMAAAMICCALLAFTACGGEDNTLDMATNAAFPPYEYKDGDSFAGIDVEIAGLIAEKLGMELKIHDIEFDEDLIYTIVGSAESDPSEFKISDESPVGAALIGHVEGDIVTVATEAGHIQFEVISVAR